MIFKYYLAAVSLCTAMGAMAADPVESRAYYSTNAGGSVGKAASVTVDGKFDDWSDDMLIATAGANDMCTTFCGSHENCVIDLYALYAAWDDSNLYLAWQCVNTGDTWARPGDGPLTDGGRIGDVPMIVTLSINPSAPGMSGRLENGNCIWREDSKSGVTFESHVDRIFYMSAKAGQGEPAMFKAVNAAGDTNYGAGCTTFKSAGIKYAMGYGFAPSHLWRQNQTAEWYNPGELKSDPSVLQSIYDPACYDNLKVGTPAGLKSHDYEYDTFYEMSIPLSVLGINRQWLEANGIGARVVGSRGESGIDCVPHDPSMVDNVFEPYGKDNSTSHEKDDFDNITYALADIAKLRQGAVVDPLPDPDPQPDPDPLPDPDPDPQPVSGNINAYLLKDGCPWSAVNAYFWDAGNANKEYLGAWPGKPTSLIAVDGVQYYHMTFDSSDVMVKPMIIFNGQGQSGDFDFINNGIYTLNGYTGRTLVNTSSVAGISADGFNVEGNCITALGLIEVYTLQGVKVAEACGSVSVAMPGLYIVKTAAATVKVNIR
ncbi:MAG: starch-binding protein [Muribaculaceae bacterium]|nr:starch-binding protein [Muribaculaceae bacterium]